MPSNWGHIYWPQHTHIFAHIYVCAFETKASVVRSSEIAQQKGQPMDELFAEKFIPEIGIVFLDEITS